MNKVILIVVSLLFTYFQLSAQYTYRNESFEDDTWLTTSTTLIKNITSVTGTWRIQNGCTGTPPYALPHTGTKCLKNGDSGLTVKLTTPILNEGVGILTMYILEGTFLISTSTDGILYLEKEYVGASLPYEYKLTTIVINDINIRYVRVEALFSDCKIDDIFITSTLPMLTAPTVVTTSAITSTGFIANWNIVPNAIGYTVSVHQGTTLVGTYIVDGQTSSNLTITGLTPNTNYTYTVIANGDGITYSNYNPFDSINSVRTINTEKNITSFTLLGVTGVINEDTKTIDVVVPFNSNLTTPLTPTIIVSNYATYTPIGNQLFIDGLPFIYTIQAEDSTTKDYTVTITKVVPSTACDITSFIFDIPGNVTIDNDTITILVDSSANLENITATLTISILSTITSLIPTDFTTPVTITVLAEDGVTSKTYTVITVKEIISQTSESNVNKIKIGVYNGQVHISGLSLGETVNIYNLQCVVIYNKRTNVETITVSLPTHGIYVVRVGGQSVKIII